LWPFLDKKFGLGRETTAAHAWIQEGCPYLGFLRDAAGPFAGLYQSIAGAGGVYWLFMLGLLGIAMMLLLGIGMRILLKGVTVHATVRYHRDRFGDGRFDVCQSDGTDGS
jgi:thiosulfate dehydrogenase [quinone] large subunit